MGVEPDIDTKKWSELNSDFVGQTISVRRPVTVSRIADAFDCNPFVMIKEFMQIDEFFQRTVRCRMKSSKY